MKNRDFDFFFKFQNPQLQDFMFYLLLKQFLQGNVTFLFSST